MTEGAGGMGMMWDPELRAWRDRVEERLGRHQVHIDHGREEDERHREAIKDLFDRMERQFEQLAAKNQAENERVQATMRLTINERLAHNERVLTDRLDAMQDEMRQHVPVPPSPLPALPWRWIGLVAVLASGMLIATGVAIGLTMTKDRIAEIATSAVTP